MVLCVACFGVSFCTVFPFYVSRYLVRFRYLSGHLLGNSCSLDYPYVLFVACIFVMLVISYFGFEGRTLVLIAPVSGHCLSFYF